MYKDNDFEFYQQVVKSTERSRKAGCGCGCLTGLVVIGAVFASILSPSKPFDKIGDEWQKTSPDAQRVIKTKRPYHEVQKNNGRQRN